MKDEFDLGTGIDLLEYEMDRIAESASVAFIEVEIPTQRSQPSYADLFLLPGLPNISFFGFSHYGQVKKNVIFQIYLLQFFLVGSHLVTLPGGQFQN